MTTSPPPSPLLLYVHTIYCTLLSILSLVYYLYYHYYPYYHYCTNHTITIVLTIIIPMISLSCTHVFCGIDIYHYLHIWWITIPVHLSFNVCCWWYCTEPVLVQDLVGGPARLSQVPREDHWVLHPLDWTQVRIRECFHLQVPRVSTAVSWHPRPLLRF